MPEDLPGRDGQWRDAPQGCFTSHLGRSAELSRRSGYVSAELLCPTVQVALALITGRLLGRGANSIYRI